MAKIRTLLAVWIITCGLLLGSTTVSAAEVGQPGLSAGDTFVRKGQEVTFVFSLEGYREISTGIQALQGSLTYDPEVFQAPSQEDLVLLNLWENLQYNSNNGQFSAVRRSGDTAGGDVLQITLTAKEDLPAKDTYVAIRELSVSEGKEDLFPIDVQIELSAVSSAVAAEPENQPQQLETIPAGEQSSSPENNPESQEQGQSPHLTEEEKEETLHQHAPEAAEPENQSPSGMLIFFLCAGGAALMVLVLLLLKKKKGKGMKLFTAVIALAAVTTFATGSVYALGYKGDLNGDGQVDYADLSLLQRHLIALEPLLKEKQSTADLNLDGELTVTDLALLIQKIEQELDYQVSVTSSMERLYYEKGEEVVWKFSGTVSHGGVIQSATVNGVEYPVQLGATEGEYLLSLQAADTPGLQTFRLTQVKLTGGQEIKAEATQQIDVLKDVPELESFLAEEQTDTAQMKVSFTLTDPDSALTSSKMELLQNKDGEFVTVDTRDTPAGSHEFRLDLEEDTPYTLSLSAQYNRDSNELVGDQDHSGSLAVMKELQLNIDYQFTFDNLSAQTQDGTATEVFHKNQPIVLEFESSNATRHRPERIVVNGIQYPVTQSGSGYRVELEGLTETGQARLQVEQVILENGKAFSLENQGVTVTILKELPSVTGLSLEEQEAAGEFTLSFRLTDPDGALSNHLIQIRNQDSKIVGEKRFSPGDLQEEVYQSAVSLTDTGLATAYTVQILGDRNLSPDGSQPEGQTVLAEQTVTARPRGVVIVGSAGAAQVKKGGKTELFFTVSHNVPAQLSHLVVNHTQLEAQLLPDGNWKVTTTAPSQAGTAKFLLTQLVFADGTMVDVHYEVPVEVMKSAPAVQGYEAQDHLETEEVTFQFTLEDSDQAFLSGKVQLVTGDGTSILAEEPILQAGQQQVTFQAAEQTEYFFRVLVTWKQTQDGSRQTADDLLLEKRVYLIRDYGLRLSQLQTFSQDGGETAYFPREEGITIRFQAETLTSLKAEQVQINGKVFDLTLLAGNFYELTAKTGSQSGVQTLVLEQLTLENGKVLAVENPPSIQIEVLKTAPEVEQFSWEETEQDQLTLEFTLSDPDNALKQGEIQISEENGAILAIQPVTQGANSVTIPLTMEEQYGVRITADYDLDTNGLDDQSNYYQGQMLYSDEIAVARDAIQFKDVTAARLFYRPEGVSREISVLDISQGLPSDIEHYYAVLEMENLPDFYSGIQAFRQDPDSGRVYAVLEQEEVVFYDQEGNRQKEYAFPLAYQDEQGVHPLIKSAKELFAQMAAAPNGSHTLTEDLDASDLSSNAAAVAGTFTGTFNGNGYKILNLPTSLFQTVSGATIQNLVIQDAQITTSRSGILANVIQNQSLVENVFIVDSSISNGVDELGAFAGNLRNSTIRQSASVNVSVKGLVAVGGIVGKTNGGALIDNCYVTGKIQGTYDHPTLGARVGGLAGWHGGGVIQNSYTQVQVIAPAQKGNGGLIGGPNTGSPVLQNCLSMSSGAGSRIAGFDVLGSAKNLYEYSGSTSATNITQANRDQIKETDAIFDPALYRDALGWDEGVWDLELLAYGKRPNLRTAPQQDNNYGIPGYTQLLSQENYQPQRELAYANLAKLMPFSDLRTWVEQGNRLPEGHPLTVQAVEFVLPLDQNGGLVTGLHRDRLDEIQAIRLVFRQGAMEEHPVSLQKTMGDLVAVYTIQGIGLPYQPGTYLAALDASKLEEAVQLVSNYDYATQIASLTQEEESRLYTDHYNQAVKPNLSALVEKILFTQAQYPTYSSHEGIQQLVLERLKEEDSWKELLYSYNYYNKWYGINYRGVDLSDLLFFRGNQLAEGLSTANLTHLLLTSPSEQRETHRTVVFYNNALKNHIGQSLTDFLGGLSYRLAGYDNPNDWFAANFQGILKEQPPLGNAQGIRYRIWDILSGLDDGRKSILLPILTAPQEDMYLISLPTQLMLGSLNRYSTYLVKDGMERQRMEEIIDAYAEKMGVFYGISSTWTDDAEGILNSFVNIQYDTRLNFPQSEAADAGDQNKDQTRDPVMKWVYEANNTISAKNGSAAFANGTNVFWVLEAALGTSDYIFFTFSHETAHNQDGRYFYGGAGRRNGTGAEAHADGNIAQEMRDGCMVFNISKINDLGVEMTNNFSYERIDSPEKIQSYYHEMFETGYVLDYLAAQAFLQLTPQQQAAVAVQAVHTPGGTNSFTTQYQDLTEEEIIQMDLKDVDDLWENRISIRNLKKGSNERISTATDGSYGFESFYNMNWYQSHNDSGSPDTHSFKRLGMEMLGVGGYEKGYRIYMSALSANDLDALRQITGREDITWKEYKMERFRRVEDNLGNIPYFSAETVVAQFKAAFEADAQKGTRSESIAVKRMLYGIVKRATGDFSHGGIYQSPAVIQVTSAEQFLALAAENPYGYYRLEGNLDFSAIAPQQGSYLPQRFVGIIDGNGYEVTGLQAPLFGDLQYAQITNLTVEQPSLSTGAQAVLAVKTRQVILGNVSVQRGDGQLPLVKTKTEGYYQYTQ